MTLGAAAVSLALATALPSAAPSSSAAPAPAASSLPEIGRVRSRALCTTLRENVAPTLAKLIEGDARIVAGRSTFTKMGRDEVFRDRGHMQLDRIALGNTVTVLARSIIAADTLLSDKKRFPANPTTDDERDAAAMKKQLQAVVDEQKHVLNLFSGLLETDLMGEMQHDLPDAINAAIGRENTRTPGDPNEDPSYVDVAGLGNNPAMTSAPATGAVQTATQRGFLGGTVYDLFAGEVGRRQKHIAKTEAVAADTVNVANADCRLLPSPAPSAAP